MKKYILILLTVLFCKLSVAQNWPACDSLTINCCTFDTSNNSVLLSVSNSSSVLFDYPGFMIMNTAMDTIFATETVNYFGIGTSPQIHEMTLIMPFTLPFTGTLNLYSLFYDTLACSFPIFIPDTVTGIHVLKNESFKIYPNPAPSSGTLKIENARLSSGISNVQLMNMNGIRVRDEQIAFNNGRISELKLTGISPGIYLLKITGPGISMSHKLVILP